MGRPWKIIKKRNLMVKKRTFFLECFFTIVVLLCFLFNKDQGADKLLAVTVLLLNICTLYYSRKNWYLLISILVITYYNYSICIAEYLFVLKDTMFTGYAGSIVASKGIEILTVFSLLLFITIANVSDKRNIETINCNIITENRENKLIEIVLSFVLLFIWIYGFRRPGEIGERGSPSTYFEYAIIIMILGFYFSGHSKLWRTVFILFCFMYALLNLIYGGRATAVQILVCAALCTYLDRVPKRWVIIGGLLAFFLLTFIGVFRVNIIIDKETIKYAWETVIRRKFANDTAFSSYHTSMTILDYLNQCSWEDRLYYFSRWLLYILFGGAISDSNLPIVTRRFFVHYGGGVFPYYFYFYLGYLGILLSFLYLTWLFGKIIIGSYKGSSGIWRCIGIYVSGTSFRWYVYSPSQITRGVILMCVAFYLLYGVDQIMIRLGKRELIK